MGEISKLGNADISIIKKALKEGNATRQGKSLFSALKNRDNNKITENDKFAFFTFQQKGGSFVLTDDNLKSLKLFDSDNDGTFSDKEIKFLKSAFDVGGASILQAARIHDFNKNGILEENEIASFEKIITKVKDYKEQKKFENSLFMKDAEGLTPLFMATPEKTKLILDKIGDNRELLEKVLLNPHWIENRTVLHEADYYSAELIFEKIGDDKKLLEKVVLAKDIDDNIPLHYAYGGAAKAILDATKNNPNLLNKVLFAKNVDGEIPLHTANAYTTEVILDKTSDNKNLLKQLLLAKDDYGYIPLNYTGIKKAKVILEKVANDKNLLEEMLFSKDKEGKVHPAYLHGLNAKTMDKVLKILSKDKNTLRKYMLVTYKDNRTIFDYPEPPRNPFYRTINNDMQTAFDYADAKSAKIILNNIANDKELTEAILLRKAASKDNNINFSHDTDNPKLKVILQSIGKDKKLLESYLLNRDRYGNILLHLVDLEATKLILNKIGNDKELLEKVLLSENNNHNIPGFPIGAEQDDDSSGKTDLLLQTIKKYPEISDKFYKWKEKYNEGREY